MYIFNIFKFIGHMCSHWHLVHCFGEGGTQEGPTEGRLTS